MIGEQGKIVRILQNVEPRLKDLTVQQRGGAPVIYGNLGERRLMPLPLMGDGIGRLLEIILAPPDARDGILLVDEIENGLHHTVLGNVWKSIAELAKEYNVQVFATTHSLECIHAAHQIFGKDRLPYDFRYHRLERVEGVIQAVTYDGETIEAAIEMDMEMR